MINWDLFKPGSLIAIVLISQLGIFLAKKFSDKFVSGNPTTPLL